MSIFRKILIASAAFAVFGMIGLGHQADTPIVGLAVPTCASCGVQ